MKRLLLPLCIAAVIALTTLASCLQTRGRGVQVLRGGNTLAPTAESGLGSQAHYDRVMKSAYCAECHPAIYAEHELNTHGRAYSDNEVRPASLPSGDFSHWYGVPWFLWHEAQASTVPTSGWNAVLQSAPPTNCE